MESMNDIEGFLKDAGVIQFGVFVAVPLANTQPILTIAEGVHPFIEDATMQEVLDGEVHIAEVSAAPEAEAIVTTEATEQVAESSTMLREFELADEVLLIQPCAGRKDEFDDEMFGREAKFDDRMAVGVDFLTDADIFFAHHTFDHNGLFMRTEVGENYRVALIQGCDGMRCDDRCFLPARVQVQVVIANTREQRRVKIHELGGHRLDIGSWLNRKRLGCFC